MFKLKQLPEDFVVIEKNDIQTTSQGIYGIFILKKRDCSTLKACEWISKEFRLPHKDIGFAGIKDRHAVTEQIISIKNFGKKAESINNSIIQLEFIGFSDQPVSLGCLKGNKFKITIRNITKKPERIEHTINYFDDQRFSSNNHRVGKYLLKKEFSKACELLKDEKEVKKELNALPSDFIGAIKKIPLKRRLLYIHAYQSYLFNQVACELIKKTKYVKANYSLGDLLFPKETVENKQMPLAGFDEEQETDRKANAITNKLLAKDGVSRRHFIMKQMPELSCEGSVRELVTSIKDLEVGELENDELNPAKKKILVSFELSKGSYATIVIKNMFAEKD